MELTGDLDSLCSIMGIELVIDMLNMSAHCIDGDEQFARYLGVGVTWDKQVQDT